MNFDLRAKGGEKKEPEKEKEKEVPQYQSTHYTDEEREKLLIGYVEVPEEAWMLLRPHTHIRYLTKEGLFRRGGFIHNVKTKGKPQIFIETGLVAGAPGYAKWPVTLEDVETLWKKRTVEDVQIASADDSRVSNLEALVEKQSREIKKIIEIMSKLNEKIVKLTRGDASPKVAIQPFPGVAARR